MLLTKKMEPVSFSAPKWVWRECEREKIHDLLCLICIFGWFSLLLVLLTLPPGYLVFRFPYTLKFLVPLFGLMLILISHDPPSLS